MAGCAGRLVIRNTNPTQMSSPEVPLRLDDITPMNVNGTISSEHPPSMRDDTPM